MERQIEKKDNFFTIELRAGEEVHIKADSDELVFISPYDCKLNCYLKRNSNAIVWK